MTTGRNSFDLGRYRGKTLSDNQPCMWCGQPADSREDIVPTWLSRQSLVVPGTTNPVSYTSHGQMVRQWPSQTLAFLKIKAVCQVCNNGWMSQVEGAAKEHLILMTKGNTVDLDPLAQVQLATWACLKVMVWESVGEGVVTSQTDREMMWKQQQPPGYSVVVLGQVPWSDQSEFGLQQVFIKAQRRPGASLDNVSATALTLGDVVAWVILNPTSAGNARFEPPPINEDLITIFPPAHQFRRWPPAKTLTIEEQRVVWRRYLVIQDEVKVQHHESTPTIPTVAAAAAPNLDLGFPPPC